MTYFLQTHTQTHHLDHTFQFWPRQTHLFNLSDYLELCGCLEVVAFSPQQLAEICGDVSPGNIGPHDGVREGEALVDGHCMTDSVSTVQHHTSGTSCGIAVGNYINMNEWLIVDGNKPHPLNGLRSCVQWCAGCMQPKAFLAGTGAPPSPLPPLPIIP